eukprot:4294697-Lingulodinium_polyedra.AAC.1
MLLPSSGRRDTLAALDHHPFTTNALKAHAIIQIHQQQWHRGSRSNFLITPKRIDPLHQLLARRL